MVHAAPLSSRRIREQIPHMGGVRDGPSDGPNHWFRRSLRIAHTVGAALSIRRPTRHKTPLSTPPMPSASWYFAVGVVGSALVVSACRPEESEQNGSGPRDTVLSAPVRGNTDVSRRASVTPAVCTLMPAAEVTAALRSEIGESGIVTSTTSGDWFCAYHFGADGRVLIARITRQSGERMISDYYKAERSQSERPIANSAYVSSASSGDVKVHVSVAATGENLNAVSAKLAQSALIRLAGSKLPAP